MQRQKRVRVVQAIASIGNGNWGAGALVREAEQAESKADFVHKMAIALKEANETKSVVTDIKELLKLLTSIIISTREGMA